MAAGSLGEFPRLQRRHSGPEPRGEAGSEMRTDWRISSFNGVLLAAYFIPTWAFVAFRIMISPIQGLYELPNVSVALFISDHLQLAALTTVRFIGFFAIFVVLITRPSIRRAGGSDEA